mmetsp:Transcript_15102/g.38106  ORF Transcript_15102/g.38106 Transcript_15102/m.38106 type:complete len:301 (-) Transcript_15102:374-1276(-)
MPRFSVCVGGGSRQRRLQRRRWWCRRAIGTGNPRARYAVRSLVRIQHLVQHIQQAGAEHVSVPSHHHKPAIRRRLVRCRRALDVPTAPAAADSNARTNRRHLPTRRRTHARERHDERVARQGGGQLHAHRQGDGAVLLRCAQQHLPRRKHTAYRATFARADRPWCHTRFLHGADVQLGRPILRSRRQRDVPEPQRANQKGCGREAEGHRRHQPVWHHHHLLGTPVLARDVARRGYAPRVVDTHRGIPECRRCGASHRAESDGRGGVLSWIPAAVVHGAEPRHSRHALRGQLPEACRRDCV